MSSSYNYQGLLGSHLSINTPKHYQLYKKNNATMYETLEQQNNDILNDTELQLWWEHGTDKKTIIDEAQYLNNDELKEREQEFDDEYLDKIFDSRYNIALDSSNFLCKICKCLPEQWSDSEKQEFKEKYLEAEDYSARFIQRNHPKIYELGYINKIKIDNTLITKVKFKLLDNNFTLENDDGFTLNDIAFLGGNLFKVNFFFNNYYRKNAIIFMYLRSGESENILCCNIGCDT